MRDSDLGIGVRVKIGRRMALPEMPQLRQGRGIRTIFRVAAAMKEDLHQGIKEWPRIRRHSKIEPRSPSLTDRKQAMSQKLPSPSAVPNGIAKCTILTANTRKQKSRSRQVRCRNSNNQRHKNSRYAESIILKIVGMRNNRSVSKDPRSNISMYNRQMEVLLVVRPVGGE